MKDLLGQEVEVGDIIAAGVTLGQTASTRIGVVTEVVEEKTKLRVRWTHGPALPSNPTLLMARRGYSDTPTFVILQRMGLTTTV
jgi:hypothetical protein